MWLLSVIYTCMWVILYMLSFPDTIIYVFWLHNKDILLYHILSVLFYNLVINYAA